jgi:hypothetical protein
MTLSQTKKEYAWRQTAVQILELGRHLQSVAATKSWYSDFLKVRKKLVAGVRKSGNFVVQGTTGKSEYRVGHIT